MAERAYVLTATGSTNALKFQLNASHDAPLVNPAFVVKGWGEAEVQLAVDGKTIPRGTEFRYGFNRTLEGTDLIVWLQRTAEKNVTITVTPRR